MSKGTVRKKIFAKANTSSGGGDPTLPGRVSALENNVYKVAYFTEINSQSGTITIPTGATILLNLLPNGADALVATKDAISGLPTGENPSTSGGTQIDVSSFDGSGNYSLTGDCSGYPVCLVYWLSIKAVDYANLTLGNILEEEVYLQADYTETDPESPHYIRNKPTVTLPYIEIAANTVYSETMAGTHGNLIAGQLYKVTGLSLFPTGYGVISGYFMAYIDQPSGRTYMNTRGYGRLWTVQGSISKPSGMTAVVEIDWYLSAGSMAGSPEFFGFEVPERNQKARRTLSNASTTDDSYRAVLWGDSTYDGVNFVDVQLKKWDKTNSIINSVITRTTVDANNKINLGFRESEINCGKLTLQDDGIVVTKVRIYAPTENFDLDFSINGGWYTTGICGTIQRNIDFSALVAGGSGTDLPLPLYSELVGEFIIDDASGIDDYVQSISGGYSRTTPFWIKTKHNVTTNLGDKTFFQSPISGITSSANIACANMVDPNSTYSGLLLRTVWSDQGLRFRPADFTLVASVSDVLIVDMSTITNN